MSTHAQSKCHHPSLQLISVHAVQTTSIHDDILSNHLYAISSRDCSSSLEIAVSIQELGCRVNNNICAQFQRIRIEWRRERIVSDYEEVLSAFLARDLHNCFKVKHGYQ